MQFFISHLVPDTHYINLLSTYDIGIESIHFSVSSVLDQCPLAITPYKNSLEPYISNRPLILHGPFFDLSPASFDSQIKAVTLNRFESVYQIAKKLHARKIVFHTGFIPHVFYVEGWLQNSILFWQEFLAQKDSKITICIENVFESDYTPMLMLLNKVAHPAFKCCLDVGHVNAYSSHPLSEWMNALKDHISHIHLHNNYGQKDEHMGLSYGTLNIASCLKRVESLPQNPSVTLEIYDLEQLTTSLETLKNMHFL